MSDAKINRGVGAAPPAPQPHHPPAVHHLCEPSNLAGAPPFAMWCRHVRTWVDGAAQQDDYECTHCGTRISTNISEWATAAAPAPQPQAIQLDAAVSFLEALQSQHLYLHDGHGNALSRDEFIVAVTNALAALAAAPAPQAQEQK